MPEMFLRRSVNAGHDGRTPVQNALQTLPIEPSETFYEPHFGLSTRPFQNVPDPNFLFLSSGHDEALSVMRYGLVTRAPVTMLTGEVGIGKTTLIRQILGEVPRQARVGLVSNLHDGRAHLLRWVLLALDEPVDRDADATDLVRQFQNMIVEAHAVGRRVILIFDEAQKLGADALESLRLLFDLTVDQGDVLQIVLVGQPELRDLLDQPELRQFAQRISADYDLRSFRNTETHEYIRHRLHCAGADREIFSVEAMEKVHRTTGGVPRLINLLCEMALVYSFADGSRTVEVSVLEDFLTNARRLGTYRQFCTTVTAPRLVSA